MLDAGLRSRRPFLNFHLHSLDFSYYIQCIHTYIDIVTLCHFSLSLPATGCYLTHLSRPVHHLPVSVAPFIDAGVSALDLTMLGDWYLKLNVLNPSGTALFSLTSIALSFGKTR